MFILAAYFSQVKQPKLNSDGQKRFSEQYT